ncbi:MAG: C-type lectin domain-containing protein, partial [Gemmatimonadetes bacterium]
DGADCGDCTVVPNPSDSAHTYLFCTMTRTWDGAAANCATHGYHLANLETEAEHGAVWMAAQDVRRNQNWWFGLGYTTQWEWTDGTAAYPSDPTGHDGWAADEPRKDTCGFLWWRQGWSPMTMSGGWKAADNCDAMLLSVCEAGD